MQSGGGLGLFGAGVVFEDATAEQHAAINAWLDNLPNHRREKCRQVK